MHKITELEKKLGTHREDDRVVIQKLKHQLDKFKADTAEKLKKITENNQKLIEQNNKKDELIERLKEKVLNSVKYKLVKVTPQGLEPLGEYDSTEV